MSGDPEDFDDDTNAEPAGPATQIGVLCAILKYLETTGDCARLDLGATVGRDLANAALTAANLVMAEVRKSASDAGE